MMRMNVKFDWIKYSDSLKNHNQFWFKNMMAGNYSKIKRINRVYEITYIWLVRIIKTLTKYLHTWVTFLIHTKHLINRNLRWITILIMINGAKIIMDMLMSNRRLSVLQDFKSPFCLQRVMEVQILLI